MDEVFKNEDQDKRERIIKSSLEEFGKNGFAKASTNKIVKNAKVSKGILFHYFKNKQSLFDSLAEYAMAYINDSIKNGINWDESDFFERVKNIVILKASITNRYPFIYEFLQVAFEGKSYDEIRNIADRKSSELSQKVYKSNIDFSLFKESLDMTVTMNIIKWTFENMGRQLWSKAIENDLALDMDLISRESDKYIEALRNAFYKETKN